MAEQPCDILGTTEKHTFIESTLQFMNYTAVQKFQVVKERLWGWERNKIYNGFIYTFRYTVSTHESTNSQTFEVFKAEKFCKYSR